MSHFTQFTSIEPIPKRNLWITTQKLYWELGEEGSNEYICVPEGFVFDGCTIPKVFGMIAQKTEARTINAGCIHDYLYVKVTLPVYTKRKGSYVEKGYRMFTRRECDDIFYSACVACGTPKILSKIMRAIIRLCGYPIRAGRIHTT